MFVCVCVCVRERERDQIGGSIQIICLGSGFSTGLTGKAIFF